MEKTFEQLLKQIQDDQAIYSDSEERTKHAAILPILNFLQWDCTNQREVMSEFSSGEGRVDYCLFVKNKSTVFIEVKKASEDLGRHEEQLLNYAFRSGVEIAILTNGLIWWFYLPLANGHWQSRKFFTIDITQQSTDQIIRYLQQFLHKDNIVNGSAMASAKLSKDNKEKQAVIAKFLPVAWNDIIKENDENLLDIIADRVENLCGYRPELESISRFISNLIVNEINDYSIKESEKDQKRQIKNHIHVKGGLDNNEINQMIDLSLKIGGKEIHANAVSDLYAQVIKILVDNGYISTLESIIPFATSPKRYLIAKQPYHQNGSPFRVPVSYRNYYLEAHKSRINGLNHIKKFLHLGGLI